MSERFTFRFPSSRFRSPLITSTPSFRRRSTRLPVTTLSFDFLLGWSAESEDLFTWMPWPPTFEMVHPSIRLLRDASSSMPSP